MKPLEMYLGNIGPFIIAGEGVCHLHSQAGLEEIVLLGIHVQIDNGLKELSVLRDDKIYFASFGVSGNDRIAFTTSKYFILPTGAGSQFNSTNSG